jgi:hypothetical protein
MNDAGLSDISEGITENIHVVGNYFNGYANIPDCGDIFLKGKDGLVYGRCAGWQISDNIIKNFGYEGIFVSPISNAVDQLSLEEREHYTWMPNVIAGNLVGHQMYGGGYNGIRCNAENVLVANNNIQLNSHVREDSTIGNAHGITISQNGQGHIRDATIIDNNITLPYGGFGISVSCCTNGLIIKDNVIKFGTLLEQNGSGLSQYAIRCGYCWGAALVENNCIMLDDSLTNIVANTEAATVSDLHSVGILDHYSKVHYRGNFIKGFPYAFGNHQALGSVVDRSNRRVDCYKPYCYINNSQVFYEETNLRATHSEPDIMQTSVPILEENSSCPSLYIGFVNKTANTSTTTITNFNDGVVACTYTLIISDSYTTFDFSNTSLKGNGGADWSPDVGDHMTCVYDGTNWYCSISDNTP